jgi:hypothetical protein
VAGHLGAELFNLGGNTGHSYEAIAELGRLNPGAISFLLKVLLLDFLGSLIIKTNNLPNYLYEGIS